MRIESLAVGEFQENTYLLEDEGSQRAVLIDPGAEPARIIAAVERSGSQLESIWITHAHLDHIGAVAGVLERWPVTVYLNPLDEALYRNADRQAQMYGIPFDPPPPADAQLNGGEMLEVGRLVFNVLHAPGHSPGHVVFHGHGVAFVGDCLFAGSVGRTDLPGSNGADLARSLEILAALDPNTVVYPGHGPATTIGEELESNPFLNGTVRIRA